MASSSSSTTTNIDGGSGSGQQSSCPPPPTVGLQPVQGQLPKEDAPAPQDTPPAYTPPTQPRYHVQQQQMRLRANIAEIFNNHPTLTINQPPLRTSACQAFPTMPAAPQVPLAFLQNYTEELEPDDSENTSPICFRISTAIHVRRDQNVVCLPTTPSEQAAAIASSLLKVIKDNSAAHCGIPMVDEDGRPRPIKIEVDAGVVVEGSGNVVANEVVVAEVLRRREMERERERARRDGAGAGPGPSSARRRRAADDGEDEHPSHKRARSSELQ